MFNFSFYLMFLFLFLYIVNGLVKKKKEMANKDFER